MVAVDDLVVAPQVAEVEKIAQLHGWPFVRIGPRCFRVSLSAHNGDVYQLEVECVGFPALPAAFHWRNAETGQLDGRADAPAPYRRYPNFFHDTGRICAPWNRLASTTGGPHERWEQASWQEQEETKGTVTLAAMVLRVHSELRSERYQGRRR